jgi:hypothetical protein
LPTEPISFSPSLSSLSLRPTSHKCRSRKCRFEQMSLNRSCVPKGFSLQRHQFYFPRFSDAMKELELLSDRISAMSENDVSFDDASQVSFNPTAEATTSTPGRKSSRLKLEDSIQQDSRWKCYKTFFVRNLRIFVISYHVRLWQAFPALSIVCR